jgi:hypothetical protein
LRTTDDPTARLTTKPTLAVSALPGRSSRWPDSSGLPARLPLSTAAENSAWRRIRAAAGSTGHHRRAARPRRSDTDPRAPLPATGGKNRTPGPGAHPQPEPVHLGPTAVVRLERTLTHWFLQVGLISAAATPAGPAHAQASPGVAGPTNATRPAAAGQTSRSRACPRGRICAGGLSPAPTRHGAQPSLFAERVRKTAPRLCTTIPDAAIGNRRGSPDSCAPAGGDPARAQSATCTTCG